MVTPSTGGGHEGPVEGAKTFYGHDPEFFNAAKLAPEDCD